MIGGAHPSIAAIQQATAATFGISTHDMTSARRGRGVARPRQVAMFIARERTPYSMPHIGRDFGGRDHTTVIHACRQVEKLIAIDPEFAAKVRECEARL